MKTVRKVIEIDRDRCDGCGACVTGCAEGALAIVDGKAQVISDALCDGLGACIGECPQNALRIVEREAEAFDGSAVQPPQRGPRPAAPSPPCGCPSARIQVFSGLAAKAREPATPAGAPPSVLGHWPVQIRLVPPGAPFLEGADLVVAADCVPVALASFQQDFVSGRAVMIGCPKFDDLPLYARKFCEIFAAGGVKSVTTVAMEVPCCSGLPALVKEALEESGADIPLREVIVSTRGRLLR
jgi:NAD-dependent dihydropyrimidine dehydrogenase PreA subunit